MQVGDLFDIKPSHTDVNEISRRRLDYGDGYAPVGYATIWLSGRVPGAGLGDKAEFTVCGVHGEDLLVQFRDSRRPEPYVWVHAGAFDEFSVLAKHRQPLPEKYWHPNWREISALPPAAC